MFSLGCLYLDISHVALTWRSLQTTFILRERIIIDANKHHRAIHDSDLLVKVEVIVFFPAESSKQCAVQANPTQETLGENKFLNIESYSGR